MALILGLNAFHADAAACLVRDGKIIAAVSEERLGRRIKHDASFQEHAIRSVLAQASADVKDLDYVALGHRHNANLGAKIKYVVSHPIETMSTVLQHFARRSGASDLSARIAEACGAQLNHCRFKIIPVEHHLAHIASSYYCSPFDEAAGFSYDGSGDFASMMYARCQENRIEVLKRVHIPHSLGFLYQAVSQFLGFDRFGEEYKVMGLSAYGRPAYMDVMRDALNYTHDGQIQVDSRYFSAFIGKSFAQCTTAAGEIVTPKLYTRVWEKRLGPPRVRDGPLAQRDYDIAHSLQQHFEEVVLQCVNWLHGQVPSGNLASAGGCALNGLCNARILRDSPFRSNYIQSAAADDGTAVGAAMYVWNAVLGEPRWEAVQHAYFGPEHSEREIEAALKARDVNYVRLDANQLYARVAELLNAGKVVGWYQGASEWGPRALGNRSILAHPGWPGMKDLINQKIKRRESFRPFAPSVLREAVSEYFEQDIESPFMMHVVRIKESKRAALAAVAHADFTGRLHTVTRAQNEKYYELISAFARLSGIPALLNTSFNENEPIVDTPAQAVDCYVRTDIDALGVGPFLAVKGR